MMPLLIDTLKVSASSCNSIVVVKMISIVTMMQAGFGLESAEAKEYSKMLVQNSIVMHATGGRTA